MALDEDVVLRDVTNAGVVISDRISREVATQLDLEEALEASRYASDPYTNHPREVIVNFRGFLVDRGIYEWCFMMECFGNVN